MEYVTIGAFVVFLGILIPTIGFIIYRIEMVRLDLELKIELEIFETNEKILDLEHEIAKLKDKL